MRSLIRQFIFNLENIYYFPSCGGGPISLHHSFTPSLHHSITPSLHHSITPSLLHFLLDIWKSGGGVASIRKGKEYSSENLNLTPTGDLCGRCLSFITTYQGSSSWLPTRFKAPSVETIMYPKLSR